MPTTTTARTVPILDRGGYLASWLAMPNDSLGTAAEMTAWPDRSVQVTGTFAGATLTIQGSNDGTTWVTLFDFTGVPLTFTAGGLRQVREITRYLRPSVNASGSGSTVIAVTVAGTA